MQKFHMLKKKNDLGQRQLRGPENHCVAFNNK